MKTDNNKVALVTGGSRGIGKSIIWHLAQAGFDIIFTYKSNEELAESIRKEVEDNSSVKALAVKCDMSDEQAVTALFKQIKSFNRRLDVVVNNAGILGESKPFLFTSNDEWWKVVHTNVSSVINTCRKAVPIMVSQKKGVIINITSVSGQKGNPGQSAYSASKAAIVSFSKALTKEVGRSGITINCVSPGLIETDMTKDISPEYFSKRIAASPLARMGKTEEVANLVTYLASDAPSYMLGQEFTIDGGISG